MHGSNYFLSGGTTPHSGMKYDIGLYPELNPLKSLLLSEREKVNKWYKNSLTSLGIPKLSQYKESLLKHIIKPMRASNNWLRLEADYRSDPHIEWLARILKGITNN
ncbi:hypothetical protein GXB80_25880 [Paenibacillus polymyxa]|nr:hypothetical protein [Paenibacillus polymyxa]